MRNPFAKRSSRIPRWFLLHHEESFSLSELARLVDLNPAAVSRVVRALEEAALVGEATSDAVGRRHALPPPDQAPHGGDRGLRAPRPMGLLLHAPQCPTRAIGMADLTPARCNRRSLLHPGRQATCCKPSAKAAPLITGPRTCVWRARPGHLAASGARRWLPRSSALLRCFRSNSDALGG